jgi:di/tricarboxylate transporter
LFICVLAFGLSAVFFNQVAMSSFTFNTQRLLIILPIAVCVFLLTRIEKVNNVLQKFWQHYLIIILYISAIYFAQAHFPLPKEGFNLILLPFTVFPFFAFALYMSYLRLRVDFKYNVFFHIGHNTSLLLIPWLFS